MVDSTVLNSPKNVSIHAIFNGQILFESFANEQFQNLLTPVSYWYLWVISKLALKKIVTIATVKLLKWFEQAKMGSKCPKGSKMAKNDKTFWSEKGAKYYGFKVFGAKKFSKINKKVFNSNF